MELSSKSTPSVRIDRELAHLKIVSRLLGHELHIQTGQRLQLSRDAVIEIQTSLDLFIEQVQGSKRQAAVDTQPVASRVN